MTARLHPPLWPDARAARTAADADDLDRPHSCAHRRVHVFGQGPHVYHRIDRATGIEEIHRFSCPDDARAAYLAALAASPERDP